MNITQQGVEDHQTVLHIEVEPERVERAMRHAAQHIAQRYRIPGFRPGKAPYHIVLQRFGRDQLFEEAVEEMGPQIYQDAVAQAELEPYAPGRIEVLQPDPLTFRALVPLKPEVDPADYRNVKVEAEDIDVTDDDIDEIIEELQTQQGTWNPVERPAQRDDQITADVHGQLDGDPMIDVHDQQMVLTEDSFKEFPPDFLDEVIGMSAGESREFDLTYPDDFAREALRGKSAHFTVEVKSVKERELPALDDQFVKDLDLNDVATVDQLRERIRINETARRAREARNQLEEQVLDAVAAQAIINYPPILTARELEEEVERQAEGMQRMGFTLDNYLRFTNSDMDQFRASLVPGIQKRIQRALLLDEVARREGIEAPADVEPERQGNARLTAALAWLVENASGKPADWPDLSQLLPDTATDAETEETDTEAGLEAAHENLADLQADAESAVEVGDEAESKPA